MNPALSADVNPQSQVNPAQGAKILAGPEDLDFLIEGPLPLVWQRSYRSTSTRTGWFGFGWASPLELELESVPDASGKFVDHLCLFDVFGRRVELPAVAPGEEHFAIAEQLALSRTSNGQYCLTDREGVTYWFERTAELGRFRVGALTDRNDNAIHLDRRERAGELVAMFLSCSGGQQVHIRLQGSRIVDVTLSSDTTTPRAVVLARYEYDTHGNLSAVFDRAGQCIRRFEYGENAAISHEVYAESFEAWYEYVGAGVEARVTCHRDNVGGRWAFSYFPDRTEIVDQEERKWIYHCDSLRRWIGLTDPAGRFTRRALDKAGNLRAIVDPDGRVNETVFDERGNPIEMRDPDGAVTKIEWDEKRALPVALIDALSRMACYEYDARGNLVAETDPAGATTTYKRDGRGLATEIVDPNGGAKRLVYGRTGLLERYTDCSGKTTHLERDAEGRLLRIIDALGQFTSFSYDEAGRLSRHTLADGSFESYTHDAAGRLLSVTDALEHATRFEYAPDSALTRRIDALGNSVVYRYDRARRLQELVNEVGACCRFAYDALDRVIGEERFDGVRNVFEYDDSDDLVRKTEAANSAAPIVSRYERDAAGRILTLEAGRSRVSFEYDAAGQLVRAREGAIDLRLQYDKVGQVVAEELNAGPRSFKVTHQFDPMGNRLKSTLPDGTTLASLYYGSGHCHQLRLNDQAISDIERDDLHREVVRTQGALRSVRQYDAAGRLISQQARFAAVQTALPVIERTYAYDRAGRLIRSIDRSRASTLAHDAVDRLTRFDEERFAFDPAHNLIAAGRDATAQPGRVENGRVTVLEDKRFAYDSHGRLVEKLVGSHTRITFEWDDQHRLVSSTTASNGTVATTRYLYDPLHRRISKESERGSDWFVWVEDELVQQWSGGTWQTFVYEPDSFTPFATFVRREDEPAEKGQLRYYHCDQIGLPRELTDVGGTIVWEATYRAWGRLEVERSGQPGSQVASFQPLRFEGQYEDAESGLHYNRFRYYDPDTGSFATADPLGLDGGESLFQYAPSPRDWLDPYGLYKKRRKNGQFAGKPGPKKKADSTHGCSLSTTKPAQGYELRDQDSGAVQKYGETTRGTLRYTKAYLKSENVRMVFVEKGTKKEMKDWEHKKIVAHKAANGGCRPRLNKSDH